MKFFRYLIIALAALAFVSCTDEPEDQTISVDGVSNISNPKEGSTISCNGETVTVTFVAEASWAAELVCLDGGDWARLSLSSGTAGTSKIRFTVDRNTESSERSLSIYITVEGYSQCLFATFEQDPLGGNSAMNKSLNNSMDTYLRANYLWNEEYTTLSNAGAFSLTDSYEDFLYNSLTQLGETNIEDGGYYREYSSKYGQRYIYSYLSQTSSSKTKSYQTTNLGIGQIMSGYLDSSGTVGLIVGYVYSNSPAEAAGLQRGDIIYKVNGVTLTSSNYSTYWSTITSATSGSYYFTYYRYVTSGTSETMTSYATTAISPAAYEYDPFILATLFSAKYEDGNSRYIGYLVPESFDIDSMEYFETYIDQLAAYGISDLILDLRYNGGGSVVAARYLTSAIAGAAHLDDTFVNCAFNSTYTAHVGKAGEPEVWTIGDGPVGQSDGYGAATDLGLSRVYVIISEGTASAAELVINALKGIDFEVYTYGSRSEGKNVGMVVSTLSYGSYSFEFAPIMYRCTNAKGEGDYADGMEPDHVVNNQNSDSDDDYDYWFPYCFKTWTASADYAFTWAFSNCIRNIQDDPFADDSSSSAKRLSVTSAKAIDLKTGRETEFNLGSAGSAAPLIKLPTQAPERTLGRHGTLIYSGETIIAE